MIACIDPTAFGMPYRIASGLMTGIANADAGLIVTVFAVLTPVLLVAGLLYFGLFGTGMLLRDLLRAQRGVEEITTRDAAARMRQADTLFVEGDVAGALRPELSAAWQNALVRRSGGQPPAAIKNVAVAFGEEPVIHVGARRRLARMVPLYLCVAGLMGVALLLLVAVSRAGAAQAVTLGAALLPVLPGMSGLFLLTCLCLLIWILVDRTLVSAALHALNSLRNLLSASLPVLDEADLLALLLEDQKQVSHAIATLGEEMPERFRSLLHDEFAPAMFESYRQSINDHLTPAIRSVVRTVEYIGDLNVKNQEEGMRVLADRFYRRLDSLFVENMRELNEQTRGLLDLQERNARMLETLQTNNHAALLLQQNVNQETVATARMLEDSRSRLSDATRVYDDTLNKTGEIAAILSRALEADREMVERLREEQAGLQQAMKAQLDAIAEQSQQLMERFREDQKAQQETNAAQLAGMAEQARDLSLRFREDQRAQQQTHDAYLVSLSEHMRDLMDRFQGGQSELQDANNRYLEAMGEQTGRLQSALETLSVGYTETMAAQTDKVNEALQSLGRDYIETMNRQILQMQDDLHSAIQDIFARFTDVNTTTFENIEQQSTATLEQLSTAAKEVMSDMSEQVTDLGYFTREINSEVAALNDALRQTVAQFGEQMKSTMEGTYHAFDEQVAGLVERLSHTTEVIRDSVEDLPAAVVAMRGHLLAAARGQLSDDAPAADPLTPADPRDPAGSGRV